MQPWFKQNPDLYVAERASISSSSDFQGLRFSKTNNTVFLSGILQFNYNLQNGVVVKDAYQIKIQFPDNYPESFPLVYETGGRTDRLMNTLGLENSKDLHYNPDGNSACLGTRAKMCYEFPIASRRIAYILDNLIIRFFCNQTYYETYGKWIGQPHAHGAEGIVESYKEIFGIGNYTTIIKLLEVLIGQKTIGYKEPCFCDSGLSLENCGCGLMRKMQKLKDNMVVEYINLDLKDLNDLKSKNETLIKVIIRHVLDEEARRKENVLVYSTEELFKDGEQKPSAYYDVVLTDIQYHNQIPRKPVPLIRQIEKFQRSGKLRRAYSDKIEAHDNDKTVDLGVTIFDLPEEKIKERLIKENKILRIFAPKSGLPIFAGQDAIEFFKAHPELVEKMQRIDRSKKRCKV